MSYPLRMLAWSRGALLISLLLILGSGDVLAERKGNGAALRPPVTGNPDAARAARAAGPSRSDFGSAPAVAIDRIPRGAALDGAPLAVTRAPTLTGKMIVSELDQVANELGAHLGALTLEVIDLDFDLHKRRAHMRVDTGESTLLGLVLDGDVRVVKGVARIDAAIDLRIGQRALSLTLPTFELVPQSLDGRRWVEFRLPLVERAF